MFFHPSGLDGWLGDSGEMEQRADRQPVGQGGGGCGLSGLESIEEDCAGSCRRIIAAKISSSSHYCAAVMQLYPCCGGDGWTTRERMVIEYKLTDRRIVWISNQINERHLLFSTSTKGLLKVTR